MPRRFTTAPDLADIESLAHEALATIPDELRRFVTNNVVIRVADFADDETLDDMGIENAFELSGLYHGIPIGEKSVSHTPQDVDMIFLYRRPLLDEWCETGVDLTVLIRHVLIHEIGHHFGFSDDDMDRIEAQG